MPRIFFMAGLNSFLHCSNCLTTGINVFPDREREHEQRHFSVHPRHPGKTSAGERGNSRLPFFRRPCCYIPAE
ncbi:hypothetical protein CXU13_11935 [Akkermansia muciniphila]|nr:hypothetical protein [Akkermansia muciniphila]PNC34048.1 hypothetical protein CXU12_06840 [Akkermansia muciniphila]PNC58175.1 hypothetical protein CXU13_11935 [Akkermansia muciniphila]